jgi:predicted regulator of Ras-like GTPase activity (Roadblock/LC7/MglB family)
VFLDQTGEAVDLWAERVFDIGPEGLRAIGAYQGIFLADVKRMCDRTGGGKLERLTIDFEHARILSCNLKEGYYLVLLVDESANEGVAWRRIEACRERLLHEI